MLVVSLLSVNIIAPLVTCFEIGFSGNAYGHALRIMPFIWLCVVVLVPLTHNAAEWLTNQIIREGDSFGACITVNILCSVLILSVALTLIGSILGSGGDFGEVRFFFYKWPRNFAIAFGVEALIAQPAARFVMVKLHKYLDQSKEMIE